MAHEYSVQTHDWISQKIEIAKQEIIIAKEQNDMSKETYYRGQLHELLDIRHYLADQIDLNTHSYFD